MTDDVVLRLQKETSKMAHYNLTIELPTLVLLIHEADHSPGR